MARDLGGPSPEEMGIKSRDTKMEEGDEGQRASIEAELGNDRQAIVDELKAEPEAGKSWKDKILTNPKIRKLTTAALVAGALATGMGLERYRQSGEEKPGEKNELKSGAPEVPQDAVKLDDLRKLALRSWEEQQQAEKQKAPVTRAEKKEVKNKFPQEVNREARRTYESFLAVAHHTEKYNPISSTVNRREISVLADGFPDSEFNKLNDKLKLARDVVLPALDTAVNEAMDDESIPIEVRKEMGKYWSAVHELVDKVKEFKNAGRWQRTGVEGTERLAIFTDDAQTIQAAAEALRPLFQ